MTTNLTRDHIVWCYRLFLGREPESEAVIAARLGLPSVKALVDEFLSSPEFLLRHKTGNDFGKLWVLVEHRLGFRIWVNMADIAISRAIMLNNYEPAEVAFVRSHIRSGQTVLDIGANIGFFSLLFSSLVGEKGCVIAFEPLPFLYSAAEKSRKENGFDHCEIHNVALGEKSGSAHLIYAPNSSNWGGAFLSFDGTVLPGHAKEPVSVEPLEKYIGDKKVDFIKIDVEGAEPLVLSRVRDYLAAHKPVIMSEIHAVQIDRVCKQTPHDYINLMSGIGYQCVLIGETGKLEKQ